MDIKFEPACRRMEWLDPFYKQVWENAFDNAIPISGTFELTPRCNFDCKMCYVHLKENQIHRFGTELSAEKWIRIAEEAKEAGTTWLCITGGEPLMHPEFETIWKELSQMGFFLTLQTNASLIQGEYARLLENFPPKQVKVTLYGTNDDIYQKVCGVKNGFSQVNEGIQALKSLSIPIEIVSTIIRQNQDDAVKMAFYSYVNKIPWAATGNIRKSNRVGNKDIESLRIVEDSKKPWGTKVVTESRKMEKMDMRFKPCNYCRDYRIGYWVLWNGILSFCSFIDATNISILNQPFKEAWGKLIEFEEQLDWPEECKRCYIGDKCIKCAATLATECGSLYTVNPNYCERIKAVNEKEDKND